MVKCFAIKTIGCTLSSRRLHLPGHRNLPPTARIPRDGPRGSFRDTAGAVVGLLWSAGSQWSDPHGGCPIGGALAAAAGPPQSVCCYWGCFHMVCDPHTAFHKKLREDQRGHKLLGVQSNMLHPVTTFYFEVFAC